MPSSWPPSPAYTEHRLPRTAAIGRRSRRASALYHRPLPVQYLAGRLLSAVPPGLIARGLRPVLDWQPPGGVGQPREGRI